MSPQDTQRATEVVEVTETLGNQAEARMNVLLLEPHEIGRRGLIEMLTSLGQVRRADACSSLKQAVTHLADHMPDVLILASDTARSEADTLLTMCDAGVRVIVLVRSSEPEDWGQSLHLQADGYLLASDLSLTSLSSALDQVMQGQISMPVSLAEQLLSLVRSRDHRGASRIPVLTHREREVLLLLIDGCSNKQVANRLSISVDGAKRHVANVLMKLNCPNRTLAVARALTEGWMAELTA